MSDVVNGVPEGQFEQQTLPASAPVGVDAPALATGGIVTIPTLVVLGESNRETIIPFDSPMASDILESVEEFTLRKAVEFANTFGGFVETIRQEVQHAIDGFEEGVIRYGVTKEIVANEWLPSIKKAD